MARSEKKSRRGPEPKPEWHGGTEPPHFSVDETERSSALQLCDAIAFRLRQLGVDPTDLLQLRRRVEEIEEMNDQARGAFNVTAPQPVTNRELTRTLGRVLHRPTIFHAPAFVLRAALGELATALVDGQRVLPALAEQLGFRFTYRALEPALESMNL